MILAGFISKAIISIIEKADDRRIARSLHKRIKKLEKYSHPRADWICLECGCNARIKEKPTRRK
jgi:hypothetical protein